MSSWENGFARPRGRDDEEKIEKLISIEGNIVQFTLMSGGLWTEERNKNKRNWKQTEGNERTVAD